MTSVSVAVPTRDRGKKIQDTLRSLLAGSRVPDEILVVDQSADDRTRSAVVEELRPLDAGGRITYVRTRNRGLNVNRNDALAAASGEFIAFVDDDVSVEREWLAGMLREWLDRWDGGAVVITGPILPGPEFPAGTPVPAVRLGTERRVFERPRLFDVLYGAHFGAPRHVFEALGTPAFDERLDVGTPFPGAGDEDFAYRVLRAGIPIVYEPSVIVVHHPLPRNWRRTRYGYALGVGGFMAKHALQADARAWAELPRAVASNLAKGTRALLRDEEPEGTARLAAAAGLVVGFTSWIIRRLAGRLWRRGRLSSRAGAAEGPVRNG